MLLDREISAERKVFNFKNEIAKIYYDNFKKASSIELKVLFKTKISMKLISIFITLASFIIIILFIKPLLENEITSGEFIGIITALFSLNQILSSSLQDASKNISEAKEYMKDLNTLLNFDKNSSYLKEAEHNMFFDSLEFKDIYFSYRNSNENILNGISFKIEKNKSYAFVGRNGAGKTTITKLITGLFDNYRGEILINGQDIKDYDPSEIKGIFSVIFQDFNIFETSIYDNIAFKSAKKELSDEKIIRVLKELKIGHVLDKLEDGIHQKIGKINDKSIEFSKGVGQKIALSRIILSDSPVKILDEPTSALDPLTENWLYEQFKKIMKEKTSILISHRLASTKICDQIFVIDNGKVVETGSHKELMKKDGLYKKMYTSQEEFYYESI
ncbi:MAG: ABC transporter ATP-binding protein [Tissierellia bacterium]|nr:ABC transporter ATP-binding protein [Tissierellia bacterium]